MSVSERIQKLSAIVDDVQGDCIILVAQVDPDAIGSAFAFRDVLHHLRPELTIRLYYAGTIGHPQNRSLFNKYDLKKVFSPMSEYKPQEKDCVTLVDSSVFDDRRFGLSKPLEPKIVIDHHRGNASAEKENTFFWIEDVGSCSTMIVEIIQELKIKFPEGNFTPMLLAMGIYTDTQYLVAAGKRDLDAHSYITAGVPPQELIQFIRYPFNELYFKNLTHALNHMARSGSRLAAYVDEISLDNADDLSTIADYLSRMDGVSLVAVWGWMGAKVRLSARTRDISLPLDEFLKKRFPKSSGAKLTPDGRGEGGALVDLDGLGLVITEDASEKIRDAINFSIQKLIFSEI